MHEPRAQRTARLRRGWFAARTSSAPRFVWGWPLGIALVSVMAVLGLQACRKSGAHGQAERLPLHPTSGEPCLAGLWTGDACAEVERLPSSAELHPVDVALWSDGTVVWSSSGLPRGGAPYSIGHITSDEVQRVVDRLERALEQLPQRVTRHGVLIRSRVLYLAAEQSPFEVVWGPGEEPVTDTTLQPAWGAARSILQAAIPKSGVPLGSSGLRFQERP